MVKRWDWASQCTRGFIGLAVVGLAAACQPVQLGQCDLESATTLVFDSSGNPAYAGQALVEESCTGCHSATARGVVRRGAPAGLDLDVVGSRGADSTMGDEARIALLRGSRSTLFEERFEMFEVVDEGSMPPGEFGARAYASAGYTFENGDPLPRIASPEGRAIYREWLSCGAPLVAVTGDGGTPGSTCTGPPDLVPEGADDDTAAKFACVHRQTCEMDDTSWSRIFTEVVAPKCANCHHTGTSVTGAEVLDVCGSGDPQSCDAQVGHAALVGTSSSMTCGSSSSVVTEMDPNGSLLVHKLEGVDGSGTEVCGDVMPPASPLSQCEIDIVRAWITNGARNN